MFKLCWGVSASLGVSLELHKMATDAEAGYLLFPVKPVFYWQKKILSYQCLTRSDLKLGQAFLEKYPTEQVPVDLNGFINREVWIAKIKKSRWF